MADWLSKGQPEGGNPFSWFFYVPEVLEYEHLFVHSVRNYFGIEVTVGHDVDEIECFG